MSIDQLKFRGVCAKNDILLLDEQLQRLSQYVSLLIDWNSKINLISRNDIENVWLRHILHSLSLLAFVDFPTQKEVLDLGTGGGLPGIPVSILRPDLKFTLVDSIRKKTSAVQDIVEKLNLRNVQVVTGRAEDLPKEFSHQYDIITSRAVAPLADLVKWSRPLAKPHIANEAQTEQQSTQKMSPKIPFLAALKGGDLTDELQSAKIKTGVTKVQTKNIIFEGVEESEVQEKKVVIVEL